MKKRPSLRNANRTCGAAASPTAYPTPRGSIIHGVNKSPGFASSYLRTFPLSQWLLTARSSASRLLG